MMLFLLRVRVSEHKQKSGPKFIEAAFDGVTGPRNTISRASLHCRRIETRNYVTPSPLNLSTNGRAAPGAAVRCCGGRCGRKVTTACAASPCRAGICGVVCATGLAPRPTAFTLLRSFSGHGWCHVFALWHRLHPLTGALHVGETL